jgi:hypothetical protein
MNILCLWIHRTFQLILEIYEVRLEEKFLENSKFFLEKCQKFVYIYLGVSLKAEIRVKVLCYDSFEASFSDFDTSKVRDGFFRKNRLFTSLQYEQC